MTKPIVIKLSGHHINEPVYLREFANVIASLDQPILIVHGGGKEITTMQQKMGVETTYVDGVRVTDSVSLSIVTMVLSGLINKRLVRYLTDANVEALGISGVDRNIVRADKMQHPTVDMGFTGVVRSVRGDVLQQMLAQGVVPVLSPICAGYDSHYNVNGDHVAGAVASAILAEKLIFLSNIEGVMANGDLLEALTAAQARDLIEQEVITGGMIPKVETALHALDGDVSQVVITNLVGLKTQRGTTFIQ